MKRMGSLSIYVGIFVGMSLGVEINRVNPNYYPCETHRIELVFSCNYGKMNLINFIVMTINPNDFKENTLIIRELCVIIFVDYICYQSKE